MNVHPELPPLAFEPPRRDTRLGDPHEAVALLSARQHAEVAAHRHLDPTDTWRQPAHLLLEHAQAQLAELDRLLKKSPLDEAPTVLARRVRITCANAANYIAFLSAKAEADPL